MPRHLKKVPPEMIFWSPTKLGHTVTAAFPEIQEDRIYPSRKTSDVYTLKIRNIKHSETKSPSLSDNCALSENHFFSRNPSKGANRAILSLPNYQNDRLSLSISTQTLTIQDIGFIWIWENTFPIFSVLNPVLRRSVSSMMTHLISDFNVVLRLKREYNCLKTE